MALAVVWSAYGFRYAASRDETFRTQIPWERLRPEGPLLGGAIDAARSARLLPEPYLWGFARFFKHVQARPAFLLGERSEKGFALFFPVTFAAKTPIALVLLLAGAAFSAQRRRDFRRADVYVAVPVALYGAASLAQGLNIGHRHLLPLFPFLFVFAGRAGAWAAREDGRWPALAVGALALWHLGAALWIHPHHLSYFNEAAGGPSNGWRIAVDSSLDWGQDLRALPAYMKENGIPAVKLSYFGTADPAYYGVAHEQLPSYLPWPRPTTSEVRPGDVLAVSATNLQGVYLAPDARALMERLRRETPAGRVGHSILIYRPGFSWPEP